MATITSAVSQFYEWLLTFVTKHRVLFLLACITLSERDTRYSYAHPRLVLLVATTFVRGPESPYDRSGLLSF